MHSFLRRAATMGLWVGIGLAVSVGGGCVVHARGGFAQVDLVDVNGYHHQGYYDDHHDWHGGWYDKDHGWHDDPHDWHN